MKQTIARNVPFNTISIINEENVRKHLIEKETEALSNSIAEHGLLEPLIVTETDGKLSLCGSYRRAAALTLLKWGHKDIPVNVVPHVDPANRRVMMLVENIHRSDLPVLDVADAVVSIVEPTEGEGLDKKVLAEQLGWTPTYINSLIRASKNLSPAIRQMAEKSPKKLTFEFAIKLAAMKTHEEQEAAVEQWLRLALEQEQLGKQRVRAAKDVEVDGDGKPAKKTKPSKQLLEGEREVLNWLAERTKAQKVKAEYAAAARVIDILLVDASGTEVPEGYTPAEWTALRYAKGDLSRFTLINADARKQYDDWYKAQIEAEDAEAAAEAEEEPEEVEEEEAE